mmetsp:Transcript_24354/g.33809  ORF Transcript_24354/g.33809 Transcript_24354/m.33809 type:complete len:607 (+) Transcript_24354:114-1934(+)
MRLMLVCLLALGAMAAPPIRGTTSKKIAPKVGTQKKYAAPRSPAKTRKIVSSPKPKPTFTAAKKAAPPPRTAGGGTVRASSSTVRKVAPRPKTAPAKKQPIATTKKTMSSARFVGGATQKIGQKKAAPPPRVSGTQKIVAKKPAAPKAGTVKRPAAPLRKVAPPGKSDGGGKIAPMFGSLKKFADAVTEMQAEAINAAPMTPKEEAAPPTKKALFKMPIRETPKPSANTGMAKAVDQASPSLATSTAVASTTDAPSAVSEANGTSSSNATSSSPRIKTNLKIRIPRRSQLIGAGLGALALTTINPFKGTPPPPPSKKQQANQKAKAASPTPPSKAKKKPAQKPSAAKSAASPPAASVTVTESSNGAMTTTTVKQRDGTTLRISNVDTAARSRSSPNNKPETPAAAAPPPTATTPTAAPKPSSSPAAASKKQVVVRAEEKPKTVDAKKGKEKQLKETKSSSGGGGGIIVSGLGLGFGAAFLNKIRRERELTAAGAVKLASPPNLGASSSGAMAKGISAKEWIDDWKDERSKDEKKASGERADEIQSAAVVNAKRVDAAKAMAAGNDDSSSLSQPGAEGEVEEKKPGRLRRLWRWIRRRRRGSGNQQK